MSWGNPPMMSLSGPVASFVAPQCEVGYGGMSGRVTKSHPRQIVTLSGHSHASRNCWSKFSPPAVGIVLWIAIHFPVHGLFSQPLRPAYSEK